MTTIPPRFPSHPALPVLILAAIGMVERLALAAVQGIPASGEAMHVAQSLAAGRGFAGAYGPEHGATAHLLPLGPAFAGFVYHWLQPGSFVAETILVAYTVAVSIGTFLLLYRAFGHIGVPRRYRLVSLAIVTIAPSYVRAETVDYRVWEGGLATLLTALFLERLLDFGRAENLRSFPLPLLAVASLGFFVNPPLGLGTFVCLAAFGLSRISWRANIVGGLWTVLFLAAMILPWAVRNYEALDSFVPLRSNAGLELAVGNSAEQARSNDPSVAFARRMGDVHPMFNADARAEVVRNGEVAYSRRMGREATAWISAHPGETAMLWARHMRQMLWPDRWITDFHHTTAGLVRALFLQLLGIAGCLGAIILLASRRYPLALYPTIVVGVVTLLMMPFQPVSRYTYVLYPLLCFLAGGAFMLVERLWKRQVGATA